MWHKSDEFVDWLIDFLFNLMIIGIAFLPYQSSTHTYRLYTKYNNKQTKWHIQKLKQVHK